MFKDTFAGFSKGKGRFKGSAKIQVQDFFKIRISIPRWLLWAERILSVWERGLQGSERWLDLRSSSSIVVQVSRNPKP